MNRSIVLFVLVAIAISFVIAKDVDNNALRDFAKWLGKNKVKSRANIAAYEGSRLGGVAAADINTDDYLLQVPRSIIISKDEVYDKEGTPFHGFTEFNDAFEPFLLFVLHHMTVENGFYLPYFNILPKDYSFHPLYWTDEELDFAQASAFKNKIVALRQSLENSYNIINEKFVSKRTDLFPAGSVTFEKYQWAYLVVSSRMWHVKEFGHIMVPLADMLNHKPSAGFGAVSEDKTYFYINATQDYKKGEQVFDNYGNKNDLDLLRVYGFVPEENEANFVTYTFQMNAKTVVQNIVAPILKQQVPDFGTVTMMLNRRSDQLLRVFRLSELSFEDLEYLNDVILGKPASIVTELKAYRAAINTLKQLIAQYPTTAEEDAKLLEEKSEELSINNIFALRLRLREKQVLNNQILVIGKLWENILIEGTLPTGIPIR